MINYKSFKLPGNAKLRVRADKIIATINSSDGQTMEIFVAGLTNPYRVPVAEGRMSETVDYIWERHMVEGDEH